MPFTSMPINIGRKDRIMKKQFTRRLRIYMTCAFIIAVVFIFVLQSILAVGTNRTESEEKLASILQKLEENDAQITLLTDSLGENNLAKARAFADILAADPDMLERSGALGKVCDRLMVDELHIINKAGIITHSTVDAYVGFDMTSGEQSAAFMVIVDDPSVEIVQEPQENTADGTYIQYIGVARKDAAGFVQVGVRPQVLEETLATTKTDVVLSGFDFGIDGYVFAVDKADGTILAHPDTSLLGTSAADSNLPSKEGSGSARVDGKRGHYYAISNNDMIIGTFLPSNEYYSTRTSVTFFVGLSLLIIFLILLFIIDRYVERNIVDGINRIGASMQKIADGDLDTRVTEETTPEYTAISGDINAMLEHIHDSMVENDRLLEKQKADMTANMSMIDLVKSECENLEEVSRKTMVSAEDIFEGTGRQKDSLEELEGKMRFLMDELNLSADETLKLTSATGAAVTELKNTQQKMTELTDAIDGISDIARQIEEIIGEINGIAGQTNLLALNASIEAARAGEVGKGFAVVATEVGALAERSAQAATETNNLITNSINAVENGKQIAQSTAESFGGVVEAIGRADSEVVSIADMVRSNVAIVSEAIEEIDTIEDVVGANVDISENSRQSAADMAGVVKRLSELVEM